MTQTGKKQHSNLCQLLPWYVNGTLDADNMQRMNDHLDACETCSEDFEIAMQFSRSLQKLPEGVQELQNQQDFGFAQLKKKISQEAATSDSNKDFGSIRNFIQEIWGNYQWLFSASGGAALSLVAVLLLPNINNPEINDDFELLSNDSYKDYAVIQIIFEPTATEQQMRGLMIMHQAELLSSKTESGVYRFKLANSQEIGKQEIDKKVEEIMSLSHVRWAASE